MLTLITGTHGHVHGVSTTGAGNFFNPRPGAGRRRSYIRSGRPATGARGRRDRSRAIK